MDYEKFSQGVSQITSAIQCYAEINSILSEDSGQVYPTIVRPFESVQNYLDAPLGDDQDVVMKKLLAAAAVIANEGGVLPDFPADPQEAAAVIDDVATRVKTAYQVGVGIIQNPEEALNAIVDAAEVRASAAVDMAFESGLANNVATELIVKGAYMIPEIGPVVGPAVEACKPLISALVSKVEEPARRAIKKGISVVASAAKSAVKYTVEKVKSFASRLAEKAFSLA